ncbi:hypothetical protein BJX99DRAFT_264092 [Aspergillus californicus]
MGSHLPPNLESLGLYSAEEEELLIKQIPELEGEFEEIAKAAIQNEHLRCITFDPKGILPVAKLCTAGAAAQITVRFEGDNCLFYGGYETPAFASTPLPLDPTEWVNRYDFAVDKLRNRRPADIIPRGLVVHEVKGRL